MPTSNERKMLSSNEALKELTPVFSRPFIKPGTEYKEWYLSFIKSNKLVAELHVYTLHLTKAISQTTS